MNLNPYIVTTKRPDVDNTFIIRLQPVHSANIFSFLPGQYCLLQNPFADPNDLRPFSISSSPTSHAELEFSIKTYGNWTQSFSNIKTGDTIQLTGPFGNFTWDDKLTNTVFLVGGLGIAPVMSMFRYISESQEYPNITLLYGSRTRQTIVYEKELELLKKTIKHFKIIHIFSHLDNTDSWKGYKGFINADIVKKEVNLSKLPTFYYIGPPIFVEKMETMLKSLNVKPEHMKKELLSLTEVPFLKNSRSTE